MKMIRKYIEICDLLNEPGPEMPRLEYIQKIIQDSHFKYQKEAFPEVLTDTLAQSSYWLDTDLFDERCLYQKDPQKSSKPVQRIHLKLLDIGSALMDKGFPLEYHPEKYNQKGPQQLAPYVKTFIEQCHKRHAFLQKEKSILKAHSFRQKTRD